MSTLRRKCTHLKELPQGLADGRAAQEKAVLEGQPRHIYEAGPEKKTYRDCECTRTTDDMRGLCLSINQANPIGFFFTLLPDVRLTKNNSSDQSAMLLT